MFTIHIYFNGQCKQAIKLYEQALGAELKMLDCDPGKNSGMVVHAEICIHGQTIMLNDFANNNRYSKSGGYQLVVQFDTEEKLKSAYSHLSPGGTVIEPMHATDYSPCVVRFIDPFDVPWAFMI